MKRIVVGAWRLVAGKTANLRRVSARGERPEAFTIRDASTGGCSRRIVSVTLAAEHPWRANRFAAEPQCALPGADLGG